MIIIIDNYDSFTYNIVQYLGELGAEIKVFRNDEIDVEDIEEMNPSGILISPGPCTPSEAGISKAVIEKFDSAVPILGVCLGHQAIAEVYGGEVVRADRLMHGKTSMIQHDEKGVFQGLDQPFEATRYHSLIVKNGTLPDEVEISAQTDQDEIMGIRHKKYSVHGVQFHPESILTECGKDLLMNFLQMTADKDSI